MKVNVKYKNNTIDQMILSYDYNLSSYDDSDIKSFEKQDFCKLIETTKDIFNGTIKECTQSIKDKRLLVNASIDVTKLSNDDLTKNSRIEDVKNSFENAGSKCEIK